ncbi:hypothetical protein PFICI_12676 [Pestalotiopsis fici W106-1]|uniref:FAD-binding domain-containing protein n=1 Tax=Pestalotiopsis fici (strain W106-1 / CGMCC3.15140) TaxID=1229662 RepID=W3WRI4_PESFW|nr:uncharacterized protein PFICI_12676 [Pestalotiopsis fici W106-1]ETS75732.1 hypothetical protein PFICI_12676 [Pestalotiopsis fici W106-1]
MSPPPHVLIVGAGIGGLLLAQLLRKQGISYEIFERDENDHDRLQGWSIAIHSMLDELKGLLPNDLPPVEVTSNILPLNLVPEFAFYPQDASRKLGVRDEGNGEIIRANRRRLREWLSTNIPVQYDKKAKTLEEKKDSVTVQFQDGTSATGSILVGADGSRSIVRQQLLGKQNDLLRWEPAALVTADNIVLSGDDMRTALELGHSIWGVDFKDAEGNRAWYFAALDEIAPDGKSGRFYHHMLWKDEAARADDFWVHSATKKQLYDVMVQKAATLIPQFRVLMDKTAPEHMKSPGIRFSTLVMPTMPIGRVTLLGDAAHSMTAFRGEGGYHAMRDAIMLSKAITKMEKLDFENIKDVLGQYQHEMLERGREAARLSQMQNALEGNQTGSGGRLIAGHPVVVLSENPLDIVS